MSARQPFIPQSKQSAASAADSSSDSLKADVSMSSDGGDRSSATSISLHSNASSDDIPPLGGINKPLNLANLGKKNKTNHLESSPFLPKARRSFEDDATRPFSPSAKPFKPNMNQRGMKIAAPSPFFPSSASFQPMSAFRAPRVPSPTKRHSAASIDDLNVNNPHTSTEGGLLGPDEEISMFNDTSAEGPRRLARSGTRGLENQPHQGQETNENRSRGGPGGGADGFTYDDSASAFDDRYTKLPARRVQKRVERTEEIDIEVDYNAPKRYKSDVDQDLQHNFNGRRESLAPYHSSPQRSPSPAASRAGSVYAPPMNDQPPVPAMNVHKDHALAQLFGQDLDTFVGEHLDAYEDAKKRWTECSLDEWTAGADELAGKFSKLLDFVKEHMNTKLALYANLNASLGSHRKVLAEREKTLEEVRADLIRNGGVVCGVGQGQEGAGAGGADKSKGLSDED